MSEKKAGICFDAERAASYDQRFVKLGAMKDGLHLCMRQAMEDLPEDANILCVGAGTGAEIMYLAQEFPGWRFTAADPSAAMLEVCRRHAAENGIEDRIDIRVGYLDALPDLGLFDAATCLLVSHFLTDKDERRDLFKQIRSRLKAGGTLISADIAGDTQNKTHSQLFNFWLKAMRFAGSTDEDIEGYVERFREHVAVLPPAELGALIESAGFETPVLMYQAMMMHGFATKSAE